MTVTTHWFVIATALAAVLASIAIWSPRALPLKVAALICATALLPLTYISLNDILSRPKPVQLETVHKDIEQVQVLSSMMKEDEAIYVWLATQSSAGSGADWYRGTNEKAIRKDGR